jgi:hypothetical protein
MSMCAYAGRMHQAYSLSQVSEAPWGLFEPLHALKCQQNSKGHPPICVCVPHGACSSHCALLNASKRARAPPSNTRSAASEAPRYMCARAAVPQA